LLAHDLGKLTHGEAAEEYTQQFLKGGYRALCQLKVEGRIDLIGIGVNEVDICHLLLDEVALDVILLAGRYTLLEQDALPLLDRCAQLGVRVIVGGPFNSGLLVENPDSGPLHYDYGKAPERLVSRVASLRSICAEYSTPLPAAALRFPLGHPAVACVLPGFAGPAQVEQAVAWNETSIPAALWPALKDAQLLAPGAPYPGGQRKNA
jgi:D-threo-aldose 1-dehydrogenase